MEDWEHLEVEWIEKASVRQNSWQQAKHVNLKYILAYTGLNNDIGEISNAPTLRLKVLNKHTTHKVHRDRDCYEFNKTVYISAQIKIETHLKSLDSQQRGS